MTPANVAANTRRGHEDEADERPFKRLTRAEAEALRARQPVLSPWRVVAAQAGLGAVIAAVAWLVSGSLEVAVSALYGALVVVIPAALMARGTTSRLSRLSVATSAFSVHALVDGEDWNLGADAGAGAEGGSGVELAGAADRAGVVHADLLVGAAVAWALDELTDTETHRHGSRRPRAHRG